MQMVIDMLEKKRSEKMYGKRASEYQLNNNWWKYREDIPGISSEVREEMEDTYRRVLQKSLAESDEAIKVIDEAIAVLQGYMKSKGLVEKDVSAAEELLGMLEECEGRGKEVDNVLKRC